MPVDDDDLPSARVCLTALRRHTPAGPAVHVLAPEGDRAPSERLAALLAELWPDGDAQLLGDPAFQLPEGQGTLVVVEPCAVPGPGWLEGLLGCLRASPASAGVTPLQTGVSGDVVPFPQGFTYRALSEAVGEVSPGRRPTGSGADTAVLAVRRAAVPRSWAPRDGGAALAHLLGPQVIDDAAAMLRLDRAWRERVDRGARHALLEVRLGVRGAWVPQPPPRLRCWLGLTRDGPRSGEPTIPMRVAAKLGLARRSARTGQPEAGEPTHGTRDAAEWAATSRRVARRQRRSAEPSVLYLLPGLGHYGGVLSVVQLVNRLLLRGVDAQIATAGRVEGSALREPLLASPYRFPSWEQLRAEVPRHDLVVTTRWDTVFDGLLLAERWRAGIVSFVQDYEPEVHADDPDAKAGAVESLRLVEHKICKSRWLQAHLEALGGTVHRIPLGLDLDMFRPGPAALDRPACGIVSPARPGVAHRNLAGTVRILKLLADRRADITPIFFGKEFTVEGLEHEHVGRLRQREVADLLRRSAVLIDASRFQGFGRPGLEAMACALPTVLTTEGGINEYARDGENCLQVSPDDEAGFVDAVDAVLDDRALASRLRSAGLATAARYDAEHEAERTLALFKQLAR